MSEQKIQHLLVLMLENRSFDHMLGYLDYPPGVAFEGLRGREVGLGNLLSGGEMLLPRQDAQYAIQPGPGHSHDDVMEQLLGSNDRARPYRLTNNGFARNYDAHYSPGKGATVMRCFTPERLPVLSTLAREFAVCDHWFCSVPGATWPNRNFAHAATSDGEVNIQLRPYFNKTIFEQLSEAGLDWTVYYGGFPPQSLAFTRLWLPIQGNWLQRFKPIDRLYRAIRHDRLPHYAFIEPDMVGRVSDSQHPGMGGEMDFRAAERLIWRIYSALRANPPLFEKTLFVVTYDEHGGFFDHVPPPQGDQWSLEPVYRAPDGSYTFGFDLLGPRVPAVLISPWIPAGTVDNTVYDHASIPATVRKVLNVDAPPLTNRDRVTNTFDRCLTLGQPRANLPSLAAPEVDEAQRRLVSEPNLRPSLMGLLTRLIWSELTRPGETGPRHLDLAPEEGGPAPVLPEEIEQEIMAEIVPQLSPEAQRVLAEDAASPEPQPFHGMGEGDLPAGAVTINILRHKAEQLAENLDLVDDLAHFVDLALRRYFEGRQVVLRTSRGLSVEQPGAVALRAALTELFAQPPSPNTSLWLADYLDRWLTIQADGWALFHDREPDRFLIQKSVSPDRAFELLMMLRAADLEGLRRAFPA